VLVGKVYDEESVECFGEQEDRVYGLWTMEGSLLGNTQGHSSVATLS
jgi:hypothetical protein